MKKILIFCFLNINCYSQFISNKDTLQLSSSLDIKVEIILDLNSNNKLCISNTGNKYLYNQNRQLVLYTKSNILDLSKLLKGVYYIKVDTIIKKILLQ